MKVSSQFKFETEGDEVVKAFPRVKGKIFLITGPSQGGIGGETAISLAKGSPKLLILAGRTESNISPIIQSINQSNPEVEVRFVKLSLDSQSSVREAVKTISAMTDKIHIIINNAAIMIPPYSKSEDGFESQLATNHIGGFLLTNLLLDKVLAAGPGSRIVNVSSSAHIFSGIRFDDYNFQDGVTYMPWQGYGQSKTANILFATYLAKKLKDKGIQAYSLHPGSIKSGLQKYMSEEEMAKALANALKKDPNFKPPQYKTLQQGCSTTLVAALDPALEPFSGAYLSDCNITEPAEHATRVEDMEKLWAMSETWVGQTFKI